MLIYPPSLIFNLLCSTIYILFAGSPYTFQAFPKGDCKFCCPFKPDDVQFHIFTKQHEKESHNVYHSLKDAYNLRNGKTTVIYIHGFSEQATGPSGTTMRHAFMLRGQENIVLVDWRKLASLPWYDHAIKNTIVVAEKVAKFIDDLVQAKIVPLNKFHVIGFSLGAETAGLVGRLVQSGKLSRITGLDPAMPLYLGFGPDRTLSSEDAIFVDVVHTDGGILGFKRPMGHADFYPNGGRPAQPGCKVEDFTKSGNLQEFIACSHNRAWKYYAASVRHPFDFAAAPCSDYETFEAGQCPIDQSQGIYMGYLVDPTLKGHFFLNISIHQYESHDEHKDQEVVMEELEDEEVLEEKDELRNKL